MNVIDKKNLMDKIIR